MPRTHVARTHGDRKEKDTMSRTVTVAAVLAAILMAATAIGLASRTLAAGTSSVVVATGQQTGISVSGEGKVALAPDIATVNVGVETRAKTVEEARAQAAQAMDALIAKLGTLGIEKKDIRTQSVNINVDYRPQPPRPAIDAPQQIDGYRVSNMLQVTVRRLDNVSQVIDSAASAAGDAVRVHGVSFSVENHAEALRQARELAMKEARAKADQLAQLSNVSVGKPVSIQDGGVSGPVYREGIAIGGQMSKDAAMNTAIEPGQSTLQVHLNVVFAIE